MTTSVVVFTRDLRVRDNPALAAACRADTIVPLFVLDDALLAKARPGANRLHFLVDALTDLDASLRARGGALVVRRGDWVARVAEVVDACRAPVVHLGDDVSAFAAARLAKLRAAGVRGGFEVVTHAGLTVVPPGELRTGTGTTYQMFTPYYRRWLAAPWRAPVAAPRSLALPGGIDLGAVPTAAALTEQAPAPELMGGGETRALARLKQWAADDLAGYPTGHDAIGADATSRCSPYLHFGCLSPLEVATRLRDRVGGPEFVRQLCWRDFFHQLLAARPEVAREDLRARGTPTGSDDEAFAAWRDGRTGYPLVDAGMRQLAREGFMHNRVRMVTASFLTKDLDVPWQLGARHFMDLLVDGDVANNQLNWQWVAGTGTDTNPHRILSPQRQSERFDPDGAYIRRYVPELETVEHIHDPTADDRIRTGYPAKLVDHADAIAAYRARVANS
jgi:deoxyribodipyrimidine photo-lyase